MKIYLAGEHTVKNGSLALKNYKKDNKSLFILESFYYCQKNKYIDALLPFYKDFILDSGAYTFRTNLSSIEHPDWDMFVERYANYINQHDIKQFIEIDIDSLVGIEKVEELRNKLELLTNKQSIPVWHFNRGYEYFKKMVDEYSYVAIATTPNGVEGRTFRRNPELIIKFINEAHAKQVKIHGLGYTSLANLKYYHFDSVDSTAWLHGNRGGYIYQFNKENKNFFEKLYNKDKRLKSSLAADYNFNEWRKLQKYGEKYL